MSHDLEYPMTVVPTARRVKGVTSKRVCLCKLCRSLLDCRCVYLYPPAVVWLEAMAETRSRINACAHHSAKHRMTFRYRPLDEVLHAGHFHRFMHSATTTICVILILQVPPRYSHRQVQCVNVAQEQPVGRTQQVRRLQEAASMCSALQTSHEALHHLFERMPGTESTQRWSLGMMRSTRCLCASAMLTLSTVHRTDSACQMSTTSPRCWRHTVG